MGRINLSAARVRQRALANIKAGRTDVLPIWADVVHDIPPAQILTRHQPIAHPLTQTRTQTQADGSTRKVTRTITPPRRKSCKPSSRMYSPTQLQYEEDRLRKQFFADHPWELARPRVVLETTGNQHADADWSTGLVQPSMPLSGESVVQRQLHLLENTADISVAEAYDVARKEFYALRRRQAINMRIAAEEAEMHGANFGPSSMSKAMAIEDAMYNDWQKWAEQQNMELAARNAAFAGQQTGPTATSPKADSGPRARDSTSFPPSAGNAPVFDPSLSERVIYAGCIVVRTN
ncbi:hypothetical protein DV737_g119, partial [Chaetothyriales sp. CBS 132003]